MKANDVIVIGGGAAGLSAALFAARAGARVTMLEKNEKFGKKLYITGKGRCNLCNDCETEEFLRNVPRNPRFLYSALRFLSPKDLQQLMNDLGCQTKVERGNRVFPVSDHASDVSRAFMDGLRGQQLKIVIDQIAILIPGHGLGQFVGLIPEIDGGAFQLLQLVAQCLIGVGFADGVHRVVGTLFDTDGAVAITPFGAILRTSLIIILHLL